MSIGKSKPAELRKHLKIIEQESVKVIKRLSPEDMESALVSGSITHPIAKTKFEALDWNIKHTLWHCGQIGLIKRIIDQRFDFGLKKER